MSWTVKHLLITSCLWPHSHQTRCIFHPRQRNWSMKNRSSSQNLYSKGSCEFESIQIREGKRTVIEKAVRTERWKPTGLIQIMTLRTDFHSLRDYCYSHVFINLESFIYLSYHQTPFRVQYRLYNLAVYNVGPYSVSRHIRCRYFNIPDFSAYLKNARRNGIKRMSVGHTATLLSGQTMIEYFETSRKRTLDNIVGTFPNIRFVSSVVIV